MKLSSHTSIDKRLGAIFELAIRFCLFVTSIGFALTLLYYSGRTFLQELSSVANVVAATSRAALVFDDPKAGERVLFALKAKPAIVYAALYDMEGDLASSYGERPGGLETVVRPTAERHDWSWSYIQVTVPVLLDAEVIGSLVVVSSLATLYQQIELLCVIAILITLVAAVGALYFKSILRRMVSVPVISLRDAAKRVTLTKDFSTRIEGGQDTGDEVSQLMATFNQMLEQLEERDRALVLAKDKAEDADRLKSFFLATVSHELRTPLHAILGMTAEVLETPLTEEQRQLLEVVTSSGSLLISIINDILDFSKIEAGKLVLIPVEIHVAEFLDRTIRMFELAAAKKGINLTAIVEPEVPRYIRVDGGRLTQVLVNLIGNALKFTSVGSVTVFVKNSTRSMRRGYIGLEFSIADTGVGIPSDFVEKIFDSFTQIRQAGEQPEGTGLGLAISSRLVVIMGGVIWVESAVGKGSTFHFTIEALAAEPSGTKITMPVAPQATEAKKTKNSPGAYTILVVEDNKVNSMLADRVLSKAGYVVKLAFNGQDAVELLERERIDLVLMDVNMPVMDGFEATRQIREREKLNGGRIPIVALTANAIDDHRAECLRAGMDEFLTKPLDRETLLATVARALPERRAQPSVTSEQFNDQEKSLRRDP